jgi:hypothetical protein
VGEQGWCRGGGNHSALSCVLSAARNHHKTKATPSMGTGAGSYLAPNNERHVTNLAIALDIPQAPGRIPHR